MEKTKRTLPLLKAFFAGCLFMIGCAEPPAQSNIYTVPLTYNVPDEGPKPNFEPTGTRVPFTEVPADQALPNGAMHPASHGLIPVGPTEESWIPMLLTATADDPGVFARLYIDMNRNGDFSDDGPPAPGIQEGGGETRRPPRIVFKNIELLVHLPEPERTEPFVAEFWYLNSPAKPEPDSFIQYVINPFWRSGSVTVNGVPALVAAFDRNNDGLYGPEDFWTVVEASMPEASKHVLSWQESRSTDRLMFLQRGDDASDLVLEFSSFAVGGSSITFEVADYPTSKAEDRQVDEFVLEDGILSPELQRPRSSTTYIWMENLDEAMASAKDDGKQIFLYFEADWCGPCKKMDEWIWTDAEVVSELQAEYVGVKLDFDNEMEYVQHYKVSNLPYILLVDPASDTVIKSVIGYQSSQQMLDFLRDTGE